MSPLERQNSSQHTAPSPDQSGEPLWKSPAQHPDDPAFRELLTREFPAGAAWLEQAEGEPHVMRRRRFVSLMGASFALAGLAACARRKSEQILPFVDQPEGLLPGQPQFYASAISHHGHARGILVKSDMGRPIKIEGNPDHPASLGATDAPTQAAVLDLYDPDRLRTVQQGNQIADWPSFEQALQQRQKRYTTHPGEGFALLIEPTSSPSIQAELAHLGAILSGAQIYQHAPQPARRPEALPNLSEPDLILAIDDDFLYDHPESLRFARLFARRRRDPEHPNRLYVIEPSPTMTGSLADHRLPLNPARLALVCAAIEGDESALAQLEAVAKAGQDDELQFVTALRDDLKRFAGRVLVRTRPDAPPAARALLHHSASAPIAPPTLSDFPDLGSLVAAIDAGEIHNLLILGGNPLRSAPPALKLAKALKQLDFSAALVSHANETSAHCEWSLPQAHFLESWGDLRSFTGQISIQQPLIEPLYQGRSVLGLLAGVDDERELVRQHWQKLSGLEGDEFEALWETTLHEGIADSHALPTIEGIPLLAAAPAAASPSTTSPSTTSPAALHPEPSSDPSKLHFQLLLRPDPALECGQRANNGWLQELPHFLTKLVWDNALLIAPADAELLGLENGAVVAIDPGDGGEPLEAPIWVQPGQAEGAVSLDLGHGRSLGGTLAEQVGVNGFSLFGRGTQVSLKATGAQHELVSTQQHWSMEGRKLHWRLGVEDLVAGRLGGRPPKVPEVTLYPEPEEMLRGPHAWAMSIDLSSCLGCNACITACQAENNIPVVGKEEVRRGREMHWIRLDRYYSGPVRNPRLIQLPVTCMHCEQAPCEVVCPVEATVHTQDGLNAMVYNRCIGTRYCSNNCPYKVRRFNFFEYRLPKGKHDPRSLQANPDVTVRGRGVMEKCSYCVQRIERARIAAANDKRPLRDGEIRTACQQACPAEAIVFGDLRDPDSRVSKLRQQSRSYALLGELNTRPRTTYLAQLENPHHG